MASGSFGSGTKIGSPMESDSSSWYTSNIMSDFEDASDSFDRGDNVSPLTFDDGLRKRHNWDSLETDLPCLKEVKELIEEDTSFEDEESLSGCPLPSTPVDPSMIDREIAEILKQGIHDLDLGAFVNSAREPTEDFVRRVWEASWSVCNFKHLPHWLQDNDYLHNFHRPQLGSFSECFKSIFSVHTETGNIWTHLLGCVAFTAALLVFLITSSNALPLTDMLIIGTFYVGAIVCFGLSFVFHTVYCHSEFVGKLFSKLDYCGIAILITGSFIPWLWYGFYCNSQPRTIYLTVVCILGLTSMIVSLWDRFSESRFRFLRAGVFAGFGLSGAIPAFHYVIAEGWFNAVAYASFGWLILMGSLYLFGAFVYAFRVPESLFPGKFDICFQSHQIFHVLTIAGAFVHLHGITEMLTYRMSVGACAVQSAVHSSFVL